MLLFDPSVYFSLFEQYNITFWPAPLLAPLITLTILTKILTANRSSYYSVIFVLAGFWLWTAIGFHFLFYATINWIAWLFGGLFLIQVIILLWIGSKRRNFTFELRIDPIRLLGLILIISSIILPPLMALARGDPLLKSQIVGITPDPTTTLTIGVFLTSVGKLPLYVFIIPGFWSAISGVTSYLIGAIEHLTLIFLNFCALIFLIKTRLTTNK